MNICYIYLSYSETEVLWLEGGYISLTDDSCWQESHKRGHQWVVSLTYSDDRLLIIVNAALPSGLRGTGPDGQAINGTYSVTTSVDATASVWRDNCVSEMRPNPSFFVCNQPGQCKNLTTVLLIYRVPFLMGTGSFLVMQCGENWTKVHENVLHEVYSEHGLTYISSKVLRGLTSTISAHVEMLAVVYLHVWAFFCVFFNLLQK